MIPVALQLELVPRAMNSSVKVLLCGREFLFFFFNKLETTSSDLRVQLGICSRPALGLSAVGNQEMSYLVLVNGRKDEDVSRCVCFPFQALGP